MSLALIVATALVVQKPTLESVLLTEFKSASFEAVVGSAKQSELRKINKDFGQSYRFKRSNVWMKEPFKIRIETKVDDSPILFIVNGTKRKYSLPNNGLSTTLELANEPGQRQTALDFGLLPPSLFKDFFVGTYVRTDRRTGEYVFDITHNPKTKYTARHRIWIDPEKKAVTKRQWYAHRGGHLQATFEYLDHVKVNGVWFPTKLTVKNADNKLAGTTTYKNVKINMTLSNDLFKI